MCFNVLVSTETTSTETAASVNGSSSTLRFARVRFQENGKKRTALLENTETVNGYLVGREVNNEGSPIAPRGADERIRMIHTDTVISVTALRQNRHYGTLEDAS